MRVISVLSVAAIVISGPAWGFSENEMFEPFDASTLSTSDTRFLQFGLALAGTYTALTDGAWGAGSQQAFERWIRTEELDLPAENWHAVLLANLTQIDFAEAGWTQRYFEPIDMSFAIPVRQMREEPSTDAFLNYAHTASSLRYSLSAGDLGQAARIHGYALSTAAAGTEPYTLRRETVLITSVEQANGSKLYVRTDLRNGMWAGIALSADRRDLNLLAAVSSSITKGWAGPIELMPGGKLQTGIATMDRAIEEDRQKDQQVASLGALRDGMTTPPNPSAAAPIPAPPRADIPQPAPATQPAPTIEPQAPEATVGVPAEPVLASTGTGFYVSPEGHLLTNAHVVDGCDTLKVDGRVASLVAADPGFDLALIKDAIPFDGPVARFADKPAPLNADITIAGFPLSGLLSGLNVTRGSVTSQKGLTGDSIQMQISAPVQPGNSGGPAVDAAGRVVGVVVAKLDAKTVSDRTGDIPQNVNFAIRGEIAKLFMFQNGIEPTIAVDETAARDPVALAGELEKLTRLVECYAVPS